MNNLKKNNVFVQYRNKMMPYNPIIPRHYTITHSDKTGELFVFIDNSYVNDKINKTRDEVRIKWSYEKGQPILTGWVLVDDNKISNSKIRNEIFKREMPKALQALRHGDRFLFKKHPRLNTANVYIHFKSKNKNYNKVYDFGKIGNYRI